MRILIIEDQENLAKLIQQGMASEGFAADYVLDGIEAQKRIDMHHGDYDLIILDFMLPGKNGLEILTETRLKNITVPILMLTAKNDKKDITAGLDSGADDYLIKPFSFEELLSRVRALLRRPAISLPMQLCCRNVKLDPVTKCVTCGDAPVSLTLKEFNLLECLMRHPGEVLSRETILSKAWDFSFDSFANVVDVHITNLRKKLGDKDGELIETIRGMGYKINQN